MLDRTKEGGFSDALIRSGGEPAGRVQVALTVIGAVRTTNTVSLPALHVEGIVFAITIGITECHGVIEHAAICDTFVVR